MSEAKSPVSPSSYIHSKSSESLMKTAENVKRLKRAVDDKDQWLNRAKSEKDMHVSNLHNNNGKLTTEVKNLRQELEEKNEIVSKYEKEISHLRDIICDNHLVDNVSKKDYVCAESCADDAVQCPSKQEPLQSSQCITKTILYSSVVCYNSSSAEVKGEHIIGEDSQVTTEQQTDIITPLQPCVHDEYTQTNKPVDVMGNNLTLGEHTNALEGQCTGEESWRDAFEVHDIGYSKDDEICEKTSCLRRSLRMALQGTSSMEREIIMCQHKFDSICDAMKSENSALIAKMKEKDLELASLKNRLLSVMSGTNATSNRVHTSNVNEASKIITESNDDAVQHTDASNGIFGRLLSLSFLTNIFKRDNKEDDIYIDKEDYYDVYWNFMKGVAHKIVKDVIDDGHIAPIILSGFVSAMIVR